MADFVTSKIEAPKEVLQSLLNEKGDIDFNMLGTFKGDFEWKTIDPAAERCAKSVMSDPTNGIPFIATYINSDFRGSVALKLDEEGFEQFIQMLRNIRNHGYTNHSDFAYDSWGVKSNACEQTVNLEAGFVTFETAGTHPEGVLKALSAKHPEAEIKLSFALHHKENLGFCGSFVYKGGEVKSSEGPGDWFRISQPEREKWTAFACELTGNLGADCV
ncbi:hypothetical protein [Pseudomonas sp. P9(2020)]|uniref:DUF1281 family ferredoxin-like fold protein n=1 Tax=Pseudomonas sp. P9(2020) TaxID=2763316 RepID=UPI001B33B216|nr:hypothetical protein [Pseudomonas sp. P9(2020)]MBP5948041.1 hypothetical protein [Pseudomonas sp. P9(2020)]